MEGTIKYQDKTLRWDVIQEPTEPVWWVHVRLDRCAAGRAVDSEPTEEKALFIAEDLAPTLFLIESELLYQSVIHFDKKQLERDLD